MILLNVLNLIICSIILYIYKYKCIYIYVYEMCAFFWPSSLHHSGALARLALLENMCANWIRSHQSARRLTKITDSTYKYLKKLKSTF